jgi:hypothetical protein
MKYPYKINNTMEKKLEDKTEDKTEDKIKDKAKQSKHTILQKFNYHPYIPFFNFIPIAIWSIIIYFVWWKDKTAAKAFGKIIYFPLIFPFLYVAWAYYQDIYPPGQLPIQVSWPFCLEEKYENKHNLRRYANWDWKCGIQQLDQSMHLSGMMGQNIYNVCYPLLLFMIVSSATSSNLLEYNLLRKFSAILLILGFVITTFSWFNIYGLFTLSMIRIMGIFQSMAISCLIIIFLGYGKILLK